MKYDGYLSNTVLQRSSVAQHDEGGGVTSRLVEGAEYDERDNVVDF